MLAVARQGPTARAWAVLAAVLMTAGLMVALTPSPSNAAAADLYNAVNASRASAGVAPLVRDSRLDSVAQAWTVHMVSHGLAHNPNFSSQIPSGWTLAGENVGYAGSDSQLHAAWMGSSGHRANIVNSRYTSVGIGYVVSGGRVWGTQVFAAYSGTVPPPPASKGTDFTSDARSDVVARTDGGDLVVYPGDGRGGLDGSVDAGHGWGSMTALAAVQDVNGDGDGDLFARDSAGKLVLYPGDGRGGFDSAAQVGHGWGSMSLILSAGDTNRDGATDLFARDSAGKLWLYPGNGRGGLGRGVLAGTGWSGMVELVSTGDVTRDGFPDLYARSSTGRLHLYTGNGRGGLVYRTEVGKGWSTMVDLAGPGDLNGDGTGDLLVVDGNGALQRYLANGSGGFKPAVVIGHGWQGMNGIG